MASPERKRSLSACVMHKNSGLLGLDTLIMGAFHENRDVEAPPLPFLCGVLSFLPPLILQHWWHHYCDWALEGRGRMDECVRTWEQQFVSLKATLITFFLLGEGKEKKTFL